MRAFVNKLRNKNTEARRLHARDCTRSAARYQKGQQWGTRERQLYSKAGDTGTAAAAHWFDDFPRHYGRRHYGARPALAPAGGLPGPHRADSGPGADRAARAAIAWRQPAADRAPGRYT